MDDKLKLLKLLSKKSNFTLLFALKEGCKKWSELSSLLYPRDLQNGLKELLDLGLIQIAVIRDTPTGTKYYELTPLGKKIVELIEEMERAFEKYQSQTPPKDPEKFIGELLKEE